MLIIIICLVKPKSENSLYSDVLFNFFISVKIDVLVLQIAKRANV